MRRYKVGNPVVVIGGKYKGKTGHYLGKIGKVMCTMEIQGYPMNGIVIWKTSICPVDKVKVFDLTKHNSHKIAIDQPLAHLEDKRNLHK